MQFTDGRLEGVAFRPARWQGGTITPEVVVLHDTASRLEAGAAARYLADNERKVSVHFVVERDGAITQLVETWIEAWHAGRSHYHGRDGVNGFSVGIEIVNPGRMKRAGEGRARAWYGTVFNCADYGIEEAETPEHGHGFWMPYPEAQLGAVVDLLEVLFGGVDTLTDITTHWYISPGRKVDTNPLFPLDEVRSQVLGREEPMEEAADASAGPPAPARRMVVTRTPGDTLNMRRWPSFNPNVVARIPDDTEVPVLKAGEFAGRKWLKAVYGGREGWIVESYTDPLVPARRREVCA